MRVGYHCCYDETPFMIRLAQRLQETVGWEPVVVSWGNRYGRELASAGLHAANVGDFLGEGWDSFDTSESRLAALEKRYGDPNLGRHLYADRHLVGCNREVQLRQLVGIAEFWEDFFRDSAPEIFISPGAAYLIDVLGALIAPHFGVEYRLMYGTRHPGGRTVLSQNYHETWYMVDSIFAKRSPREASALSQDAAQQFLATFRAAATAPDYMDTGGWYAPAVTRRGVREMSLRFRRRYLEGWGEGNDYLTIPPLRSMCDRGAALARSKVLNMARCFEQPRAGERYLLFGLHFQPEATTLIMAPHCVDQLACVENVAKCLPATHWLYVKEHAPMLGRRSVGFYRRLKGLRNVRVLSPFHDTQRLIRGADAVVTITGTMGWEALLHGVPAIVLGKVFYLTCGLAYVCHNLYELPELVRLALTEGRRDDDALLRFLAAIYEGSFPGFLAVPHVRPTVMDSANIQAVASGLVDIVKHPDFRLLEAPTW